MNLFKTYFIISQKGQLWPSVCISLYQNLLLRDVVVVLMFFSFSWRGLKTTAGFQSKGKHKHFAEKNGKQNGTASWTHIPEGKSGILEVIAEMFVCVICTKVVSYQVVGLS